MNLAPVDEPWPVHLGAEAARFDGGIAISPILYLRRRVRLEHENATQRGVLFERTGDHEFVFGSQLADVGHVFCLQLLTRFFTKLRSIGGTTQQYEEVLSGLGIGLGLSLRERVASKCEQAEQKYVAEGDSSCTRNTWHRSTCLLNVYFWQASQA